MLPAVGGRGSSHGPAATASQGPAAAAFPVPQLEPRGFCSLSH